MKDGYEEALFEKLLKWINKRVHRFPKLDGLLICLDNNSQKFHLVPQRDHGNFSHNTF